MTVDENLAHLSNNLVYSAMAAYAAALAAFTIDLSGRGRVAEKPAEQQAAPKQKAAALTAPGGRPVAGVPDQAAGVVPEQVTPERRKAAAIGVTVTWLAFLLHLGGVIARGAASHRAPWGNMYEFSVSGAVVVTGVFLVTLFKKDLRFLGTFVVGPVLLILGLAVTVLYTEAAQLVPALQSYWLIIHVSIAFIASALLTLGFSVTIIQLVQDRREQQRAAGKTLKGGNFMNKLPPSAELEHTAYRLHAIAFPLWTFTLMAGAIWAEKAWGRYWNWDPKEVWTFVIWVVYAGYLHARATRGWDGRRAAYFALVGYACVLVNFLVVNIFFSGLHSYAGVGSN
ncbi:c-type cytochrome biogenesis protein CcsB [Spongisporangium articulatum]|uniref:C-type cytochrome biogenesis protein CcsB n=1 Tax=Spongisporangium articulatum TaxID=3362603 RepID=A0ABW8ANM3_9ACTN